MPKDLERVRLIEDLSEDEKICAGCSKPMTKIGEDVREELDYVPASLVIKEHVRPKYARSTMCDWVGGICERLMPLRAELMTGVLACDIVHADDTPLLCLENAERRGKSRAALWVYRSARATLFDLRPNRSRDGPSAMLASWKG